MLEYVYSILSWYTEILNTVSHGNHMMAAVLSAATLGFIGYLIAVIPRITYGFIKRNFTTSFTINNTSYDDEFFVRRMNTWLSSHTTQFSTRSLSFNAKAVWDYLDTKSETKGKEHNFIGTGYGIHWFFYKNRLFWFNKEKLDSSGSEKQKEEYTFYTFGRSHNPFYDFVEQFTYIEKESGVNVYVLDSKGEWNLNKTVQHRSIDSVIINEQKKNEILENINHFKENKEWFMKAALPYKLTYILHGIPGTGKTSLIKAIASYYKMNLCIININAVSDSSFERAISTMPRNSVLAIEDFDSNSAFKDRGIDAAFRVQKELSSKKVDSDLDEVITEEPSTPKSINITKKSSVEDMIESENFSMLTLSGILNTLDGLIPLHDVIIFLTTNKIENIDPALYRKGRVDYLMEIAEITNEDIKRYCEYMFPNYDFSKVVFNSTVGCNINEALLYSRGEPERFLESLERNNIIQ